MTSVGKLLIKTEEYVILTRELNVDNKSARGTIVIPIKDIQAIEYLSIAKI